MRAKGLGFLLILGVVLGSLSASGQNQKPPVYLAKHEPGIPWTADNLGRLKAIYKDPAAVYRFLAGLNEDDFAFPCVAEYQFADLAGDGNLELLVSLDPGGRGFTNELSVVWQIGSTYQYQDIEGWQLHDLSQRIVRLDETNRREVLVDVLLAEYQFTRPTPGFTHVYAWTGSGLVQADARFKSYYRGVVLPELRQHLQEVASWDESSPAARADKAEAATADNVELDAVEALLKSP